jgi:hypothetical protein
VTTEEARRVSCKESCHNAQKNQQQAQSSHQPTRQSSEPTEGKERRYDGKDHYRYSPRKHLESFDGLKACQAGCHKISYSESTGWYVLKSKAETVRTCSLQGPKRVMHGPSRMDAKICDKFLEDLVLFIALKNRTPNA